MNVPPDPPIISYMPRQEQKTSRVAIASLVLGIVGMFLLPAGVAAIVCGALGMSKTKKPCVGGRQLAIAGLTLGIVGIVLQLLAMLLAVLFFEA